MLPFLATQDDYESVRIQPVQSLPRTLFPMNLRESFFWETDNLRFYASLIVEHFTTVLGFGEQ